MENVTFTNQQLMTMLASLWASYSVVMIAIGIASLVALWRIFTKAGEAGWKCLIPVYNLHVFARISWKASYFWITVLIASVLTGVGTALNNSFSTILMFIGLLVELVYIVLSMNHLAKRFGKGTGFTVLLVLLSTLAMMILGFGTADYSLSRDN